MSEDDVVLGFGPFEMPLVAAAEGASEVMAIAEERWRQAIRDDGDDRDGLDDGRRVKAAPELE